MKFAKASKKQARLRMGLMGPAGSGKTFTALAVAAGLGGRVALIDTEHGSASKYADRFEFDALELTTFAPATYVEAIHAAEAEGYDCIIVDSLSHAWTGVGGALDQVDKYAKRNHGKSFDAWREVTPQHNALVEAMLGCKAHLLATLRVKTEYLVEQDERGKMTPKRVGLAPVQRDGLEYEFDVLCDLDRENNLIVGKTRCPALSGAIYPRAGADVATVLRHWLSDGVSVDGLRKRFEDLVAKLPPAEQAKAPGALEWAGSNPARLEQLLDKWSSKLPTPEPARMREPGEEG